MFETILGNNIIKDMLKKSILNNTILNTYMFIGIDGIGKKMIATEFAKAILCLSKEKYCDKCKSCIEFDSNNHPDFMILKPEGNNIKIEQIRELQKKIIEKPIISTQKVYIIDKADTMTKEAQNCLLKTIEEPPDFARIILLGENVNAFLLTIKSRCMILNFNPIEDEEIKKYLQENYQMNNITKAKLDLFQGSIGKAITLKDKLEQYEKLENFVENIERKDLIDNIKSLEILYKEKEEIIEMLEYINILLLKKAKKDYRYTKCVQIVEETKKRIKQNANYDMCIDNMIFNIWRELN